MKHSELLSELLSNMSLQLHSAEFLEGFRAPNRFVRNRKLSMRDMVLFLLFCSKTSLDNRLDQLREKFPDHGFPLVSKQALSKARSGIKPELFRVLFESSAEFFYENISERQTWNGYHLFAIDGSTQELPSSESIFKEFGKQSDKKNPKLFWSMGLASILYDVLDDVIVDAGLERQFFSEREFSFRHMARLIDLDLEKDSIVIFDRGYYSYETFETWVRSGCNVLMRLKNPNSLCNYDEKDAPVVITCPDKTEIMCRVIEYPLPTGEVEYLITNVMDPGISSDSFGELYFNRWKIETKYLELKEHWKIEEFTGTSSIAVRQDFYITLLHANLASFIKSEADKLIGQTSRATNSYRYTARRTYIISKIHLNFVKWLLAGHAGPDIDEAVVEASKKRSQVQPERSGKRKRQTRARKHYSNRKATF